MEENSLQSTRKRPRLDSGSGVRETWSTDKTLAGRMSEPTDAPALTDLDPQPPTSTRPASRVTINMKSPSTDDAAITLEDSSNHVTATLPAASPDHTGADASNAISVSSSRTQSPEIEVAELEDMDQDPSTSSWKSLGETLRDPEVVQLHEQQSLIDMFPRLRDHIDQQENLEEIAAMLEKGPPNDSTVFLAVKAWLDDAVQNLDQLSYNVLIYDREFWEEIPLLAESVLRRGQDLQPNDAQGPWACLEEFFLNYARLAVHMTRLDTLVLRQLVDDSEHQVPDLISRPYLVQVGYMLQISGIPLFRVLERLHGPEAPNLVARLNDQLVGAPFNIITRLTELTAGILLVIQREAQLSTPLISIVNVVHSLVDSWNERRKFQADESLVDSPAYLHLAQSSYTLIRPIDEKYQFHVTKKSSWVSSDVSESMIRLIPAVYITLCRRDPDLLDQIAKDLEIELPDNVPPEEYYAVIFYGWKFAVLKKHIMDGRMELRVFGIEWMQNELVGVWKQYIQQNPNGTEHPVAQFLLTFLRDNQILQYIVGIDSHPQLISRSANILGFLIVTGTYTDADTDIIWKTVTESPDPRTVSEVLGMLSKTFHMHAANSPALLYICSKVLELSLDRFDPRMVEFCDQLLHQVREKHGENQPMLGEPHIDVIPLRLCVRLIRESAAAEDLPVEQKALLQKFASSQLSLFMDVGLSEMDKMETYERCVQDIAEMNQFTVGSIQALNALIPNFASQEIQKLAMDFDLARLVIAEIVHTVKMNAIDFTDSFSKNGFLSRIQLLARIIDKIPEYITDELSDVLWWKVFISKGFVQPGRRALWDVLCGLISHSSKRNPFIERCIHNYFPKLSPTEDYFPEVLAFAKQTINYEIRFDPPPIAAEGEVVTVPGMDRIWNFILTALPGSIETNATNFAIEVYLDHGIIRRSPRSAIEATHIALVDRCVEQLKSAADKLKSYDTAGDKPAATGASDAETRAEELRFSRSLLFLRQFLQGLRSRPQYSPPQGPPPGLPGKGTVVDIRYQAFDGGGQSKVRVLRIGDLSTASELVERLVQATGFSKFSTIYSGQKFKLLEKPEATVGDLKLTSGLLIIRRDPDSREVALTGRRQSLTSVDSEVLKHFDDLYDLLSLNDRFASEIYDFLVVFPPQERVLQLVKSTDKTEQDMFPIDIPYSFLYSVNALSICLREEALEPPASDAFVSHSIEVLVAALTRPAMSELAGSPIKLMLATSLVECLLYALLGNSPCVSFARAGVLTNLVKPCLGGRMPSIPNSTSLVRQLINILEVARTLHPTYISENSIFKLICHSFAILTEGSTTDPDFWAVVKQETQFDQLLFSLLLDEPRQPIRKGISENIAVACSPSALLKKADKSIVPGASESLESLNSDQSARIDILATIWDAFLQNFPRTPDFVHQSQEFFEIAHIMFQSVSEKSPSDEILSKYLHQWSGIILSHQTEEFVGREPVDHFFLGFCRLLRSCLELANSADMELDTLDLAENLFDKYLFPDLSMPSPSLLTPQIPLMNTQTRQELYSILSLLCKNNTNYFKIVERLEEIIPTDETYSPSWCFDRHKMIRSPEGYAGLRNLSNTCYLNSLMTQLFMNIDFRDFLMQLDLTDPGSSQKLLYETKKVFAYMQETWLKSVDPQDLVDSIRTYDNEPVDVTIQMDVDEFYNLLFDRWEAQILNPENKKKFRSFYGGQLVQQIKSKECPHISERLEPFSAIQCDIKGKASLEESLQAYVEGEIMQGDNKYSCTSCGRHVDAVKRACLKEVPDNLIFHLKRFDFDMVTMMRSKINDEFQFPEHIDMSPFKVEYLSDPNGDTKEDVFELVGVLVHTGTAESGHYYSYIRERPTADGSGSWVEFNDSDVTRFDKTKIADQCFGGFNDSPTMQVRFNKVWNAYMLFYQRVSSMESTDAVYKPQAKNQPARVSLPVPLANHIAMENEVFVRTYCLSDPYHFLFVRFILSRLHDLQNSEDILKPKFDKTVIFIGLDTLEQLVSRTKDPLGLDGIVAELLKAINELPKAAHRVLQWVVEKPAGVRNLILKSPHATVRSSVIKLFICALSKLQEFCSSTEAGTVARDKCNTRYWDGFENLVATLDGLWGILHTASRAWDDYFEFLLLLASFGSPEAGIVLKYDYLLKCFEIVWLDREDAKRLKRQYVGYSRLVDKGRRFSHRKLTELLLVLLCNIDLTVLPTPDDERHTTPDGKYTLTVTESTFVRPIGRSGELVLLRKILQQNNSPQACRSLVGLLVDAEPEAGLIEPICKVLEDGLRVAPAELCYPFLEATLIFCRRSPDKDRIIAMIEYVAKGVETINDSGGKEHLSFFTELLSCRNDRIDLDETWFSSRLIDRIPDWAPTLLLFPDFSVRNMTTDLLQNILFTGESGDMGDDWQQRHTEVAKALVSSSVERLNKVYITAECNVEARVVETIKAVINHCLVSYYGESEQEQQELSHARAVIDAIDELTVDVPEELASDSDIPSAEGWEDNSMMASDSEVGVTGSP
ncbi:hypothetical protein FE257_010739 [Aspergillus nanangensis]|uniref:USP domain-containing protein n=1 Tax=Aspergillus nanangensis TaxID=2582783 RepID=A0AAD4GXY1_ASPNN|nr:hypothetical protein FE257_010739 [Aspergillus nanangensis]